MTMKQKTPQAGRPKRGWNKHIKSYSGFSLDQDKTADFKLELFKSRITQKESQKSEPSSGKQGKTNISIENCNDIPRFHSFSIGDDESLQLWLELVRQSGAMTAFPVLGGGK